MYELCVVVCFFVFCDMSTHNVSILCFVGFETVGRISTIPYRQFVPYGWEENGSGSTCTIRGGPALNCGTYASLMVLKYFQAFETHPPPSM